MRGAQFRAERVARELTQEAAARILAVDVSDIQEWEHDRLKVPAWAAKAIANNQPVKVTP